MMIHRIAKRVEQGPGRVLRGVIIAMSVLTCLQWGVYEGNHHNGSNMSPSSVEKSLKVVHADSIPKANCKSDC